MELRVWVDGTQRVVCGVKLTTTCQEIVFALAHATQQAGRFTMIERWRNNERLLSPSEQPLVTLQRWGDHMNEVEFILRKTSPDTLPPSNQTNQSTNHHLNGSNGASSQPNSNNTNEQPPSQQAQQNPSQPQIPKNFPYEELYSTIQKKRNPNPPPIVPIKPRLVGPISNIIRPHQPPPPPLQQLQPVTNSQINYYHRHDHSPMNLFANNVRNLRSREALSYQDLMNDIRDEVNIANSLAQQLQQAPQNTLLNNTNHYYDQRNSLANSNMYQTRPYPMQPNGSNSINPSPVSNRYIYPMSGSINNPDSTYNGHDDRMVESNLAQQRAQSTNSIRPKLIESNLIINRGSAVNVKLPSNSLSNSASHPILPDSRVNDSPISNTDSQMVSQIGHDMLRVIEEQKKVLINRKNELDRIDKDQWDTQKHNSEQKELISRIDSEIKQLEELWKENQTQIKKLENQDFEKVLKDLKSDQEKMEKEIEQQKSKLSICERGIIECKTRIEQLEAETAVAITSQSLFMTL